MSLRRILYAAVLTIMHLYGRAQSEYELNAGWQCKKASEIASISGNKISDIHYNIKDWMPATVPGTVLTTLLNNKKVPDPFYGMNNEHIPDIYDAGKAYYTYWFAKDFEAKAGNGKLVWLLFRGVNYGFDVFLNGHKLNKEIEKGMFLRRRFNITSLLAADGKNRLAVIVYPPDAAGNPNGGQGGDGTIAKNVAHQYVAGWDWIQPVRDRNTGIWDKVFIETTGSVTLSDPHVVTKVPGVRYPGDSNQAPAFIQYSATLHNVAAMPVSGTLQYTIDGQTVKRLVTVPAKTDSIIKLPELEIQHPHLWWCNGVGKSYLYQLTSEFITSDNKVSDKDTTETGIREIQTAWNDHTKSREIKVNGRPVFIKGGNWIVSDAMLRLSKERYDAEIRFHHDMRLNLIRVWGGALTERPEFYEACDKYGMLVMQDFWGSGDCNGRWTDPKKKDDQWTRRKYPDDHKLFVESAADQIKMLRNFPSLAFWCGGNEITQPEDLQRALKDSLMPLLDGTRWFVDYSNSDSMSYNTLGGNGDGPYGIQPDSVFWQRRTFPFNSEIGSVGIGDATSLQRFIPKENQVIPVSVRGKNATDSVWDYHKYIGYGNAIKPYGEPKDMIDFANKAQLVNYDQYRSLIEGFSAHEWDWYTGVIIWKTQNPWTALRGQMYDYYLDPNACLYGLRAASEPLHLMYNPADSAIYTLNNTYKSRSDLMMVVKGYDMQGKETVLTQVVTQIEPQMPKPVLFINHAVKKLAAKEGMFLCLQLLDMNKQPVSENIYWLPDSTGNYSGLQRLAASKLQIAAKRKAAGKIEVTLSNAMGNAPAFFNRLSVIHAASEERVLPSFYSDNYVTLMPGETKKIMIDYPAALKERPRISVSGWNLREKAVEVKE